MNKPLVLDTFYFRNKEKIYFENQFTSLQYISQIPAKFSGANFSIRFEVTHSRVHIQVSNNFIRVIYKEKEKLHVLLNLAESP